MSGALGTPSVGRWTVISLLLGAAIACSSSSGSSSTTALDVGLSDAEAAVVELRVELAAAVRERRMAAGLTQAQLAKAFGSSQSRVAKLEGADSQASLESMVRALAVAGARIKLRVA
jgi:predicted XRE-type DNA-binding protein